MWRSKKLAIGAVVVAMALLAGSIGVVLAQDDGEGTTLLDRVGAIYQQITGNTLDQEALKDAYAQARGELREEALVNRLQKLVDEGKITQEQADEYLEWWQSMPDMPEDFAPGQHGMRGPGGIFPMTGE
jgi:hypothetical protein